MTYNVFGGTLNPAQSNPYCPSCKTNLNPIPNIAGPMRVRRRLGACLAAEWAIIWQKQPLLP